MEVSTIKAVPGDFKDLGPLLMLTGKQLKPSREEDQVIWPDAS